MERLKKLWQRLLEFFGRILLKTLIGAIVFVLGAITNEGKKNSLF